MTNKIHKSLKALATDINTLTPLENNPHVGNIDAIVASYREFGQLKPIVARHNEDGTSTVIAGNHQLEAARELGWDKIAVLYLDGDVKRSVAFALADNRTSELGYTDPDFLMTMILDVNEIYPELFDDLGWDEFEIASYQNTELINDSITSVSEKGFTAPVMVDGALNVSELEGQLARLVGRNEDGENYLRAPSDADQNDIAIRGSTVAIPGAAPRAAVQYTIVFDDVLQQARWYSFVRWLRANPSIDGNTTAERLVNFIGEHTEV